MVEIRHRKTGELLVQVEACWLGDVDLTGAALPGALVAHEWLKAARLRGADLTGADLRGSTLDGADLERAQISGANLYDCVMCAANLRGADLTGADLRCAYLAGADLTGAALRDADLRWAALLGACLGGADLTGAVLEGAVFDGARDDVRTRWPERRPRLPASAPPPPSGGRTPRFRRAVTRRVGRAAPGTLRLWSVQTPLVWDRLQREGVLYTDPDCIWPNYRPAYDWLREQMARSIPDYAGHYPWWAWHEEKHDLRTGFGRSSYPGQQQVRLELAVPTEQVLLSDFQAWHCVLNRCCLHLNEGEHDAWEAELLMSGVDPRAKALPEPWNGWMHRSWERIFDFEALAADEWWAPARDNQATFERLELAHVVTVTEFVTRKSAGWG